MCTKQQNSSIIYIGLGSNLNQPKQQLQQALLELDLLEDSYLLAYSSFYRSAPMGPQDQDHYINAVAKLSSKQKPLQLLDSLQAIEEKHQRIRKQRWGERTLDLDILLYDHTIISNERLIVPHYGMKERDFVLFPLFEIAPKLDLPDGSKLVDLLDSCDNYQLTKLG